MKKIILTALPTVALLSGCANLSDRQMARFNSMSCAQLDVAFDYEQDGEREAGTRAFFNSVTSLTTKGSESTNADLDSLSDQLDEDEHRAAKKYIRERQDRLGC